MASVREDLVSNIVDIYATGQRRTEIAVDNYIEAMGDNEETRPYEDVLDHIYQTEKYWPDEDEVMEDEDG